MTIFDTRLTVSNRIYSMEIIDLLSMLYQKSSMTGISDTAMLMYVKIVHCSSIYQIF